MVTETDPVENELNDKERCWTIELNSKASLKNVTMTNGSRDSVLVEGTLGELVRATFADGIILEVVGKKGTLRINLVEGEIKKSTDKYPGGKDQ